MKRGLQIGAFLLACLGGLSLPANGAGAVTTKHVATSCETVRYDETTLVWNTRHTTKLREIVYKIEPEKAPLDGHRWYGNVAVAVVFTKRLCVDVEGGHAMTVSVSSSQAISESARKTSVAWLARPVAQMNGMLWGS